MASLGQSPEPIARILSPSLFLCHEKTESPSGGREDGVRAAVFPLHTAAGLLQSFTPHSASTGRLRHHLTFTSYWPEWKSDNLISIPDTAEFESHFTTVAETMKSADNPEYDLLAEGCITFAQAARMLPSTRGKKHTCPATVARWALSGLRIRTGIRTGEIVCLEYIKLGGTNCTSRQAIGRFFARLRGEEPPDTRCTPSNPAPPEPTGTSKQNSPEKRAEQATDILRRRGIVK